MSDAVRFLDAVVVLVSLVYAIHHYRSERVNKAIFWLLLATLAAMPPR